MPKYNRPLGARSLKKRGADSHGQPRKNPPAYWGPPKLQKEVPIMYLGERSAIHQIPGQHTATSTSADRRSIGFHRQHRQNSAQ